MRMADCQVCCSDRALGSRREINPAGCQERLKLLAIAGQRLQSLLGRDLAFVHAMLENTLLDIENTV